MTVLLLIAARIFVNALSNVFQKKLVQEDINPVFIIFIIHFLLSVTAIPFFRYINITSLSGEFYLYIIGCALFAVSGNSLLVLALKHGDLSLLGPVNSYKSIISMILGIFLINEIPGLMGLIGVLLIVAGSYVIADKNNESNQQNKLIIFFKDKGIQLRLGALLLTGIEAVLLKKAITLSSPWVTFLIWCLAGFLISGFALLFRFNKITHDFNNIKIKKATLFYLFLTTGIMQLCTLLVFNEIQVGYSLALFQISSLLSVFLGYHYFNEKNILKRFSGAVLMLAGSVLIILFRN